MAALPETCTKGEFAALCNVSGAAVSQWIRTGKITPDALVGGGRSARIRPALAMAQVNQRRDVSQALGNGSKTRLRPAEPTSGAGALTTLPLAPPSASPTSAPAADRLDPVEERIKQEKLDEIARRNRIAAAKEAADAGIYVETAVARREMSLIAGGMMQVLEQALDTFATATAAKFQVPQRDVVHLLRAEFRSVRERAADKLAARAAALPALVGGEGEGSTPPLDASLAPSPSIA